jgi:hypothetical protein
MRKGARISRRELAEHERKLQEVENQGQRKLMADELKRKREEYWPRPKWPPTAKIALGYIFLSCTVVQIYSMAAMWHFADLSALYSLIGATVGETISYCAYAAKSARENMKGGIVHDMAMKDQEGNGEAQEGPENEAKG